MLYHCVKKKDRKEKMKKYFLYFAKNIMVGA